MNAKTGPLRRPTGRGDTGTLSRSGNLGRSRKLGGVRQANMEDIIQPPSRPTEPLSNAYAEGTGATEVLSMEEREVMTPEKAQQEVDESFGMFRIEKYILLIHTDEVV